MVLGFERFWRNWNIEYWNSTYHFNRKRTWNRLMGGNLGYRCAGEMCIPISRFKRWSLQGKSAQILVSHRVHYCRPWCTHTWGSLCTTVISKARFPRGQINTSDDWYHANSSWTEVVSCHTCRPYWDIIAAYGKRTNKFISTASRRSLDRRADW